MWTRPKFSSICGENVEISESNTKATWAFRHSGGWAYSEAPLVPGESVTVKADGSGSYNVGFIYKNPEKVDAIGLKKPPFTQMNVVRIHKTACRIVLKLNERGNELVSIHSSVEYRETIQRARKIWLAVYVKFGDISLSVFRGDSPDKPDTILKLSKTHGTNITIENDCSVAKTTRQGPAAVCLVNGPIGIGEKLSVLCTPTIEDKKKPSLYRITVFASANDPKHVQKDHRYLFDTKIEQKATMNMFSEIACLHKDKCDGEFTLEFKNNTTITCKGKTFSFDSKAPQNHSGQAWIGFEVFRVSVVLENNVNNNCYINGGRFDIPDGLCLKESNNKLFEDSMSCREDYIHAIPDKHNVCLSSTRTVSVESNQQVCDQTFLKQAYVEEKDLPNIHIAPKSNIQSRKLPQTPNEQTGEQRFAKVEKELAVIKKQLKFMEDGNLNINKHAEKTIRIKDVENTPERLDSLERSLNEIKRDLSNVLAAQQASECSQKDNSDPVANTRKNFTRLVSDLDFTAASDLLYEKELITEAEMKRVQTKPQTREDSNKILLEILKMKHIRLSQLSPVLDTIKQKHLIPLFFPCVTVEVSV